jgi:hypothetical protein
LRLVDFVTTMNFELTVQSRCVPFQSRLDLVHSGIGSSCHSKTEHGSYVGNSGFTNRSALLNDLLPLKSPIFLTSQLDLSIPHPSLMHAQRTEGERMVPGFFHCFFPIHYVSVPQDYLLPHSINELNRAPSHALHCMLAEWS